MAITLTQDPTYFNLAYGVNPFRLNGIETVPGAVKYVFQIWSVQNNTYNTANDLLADVRQSPNAVNSAMFDVQNILQSYVHPSEVYVPSIPTTTLLVADGAFRYIVKYGTEDAAGVVTIAAATPPYTVFPGRKVWWNLYWRENFGDEEWSYDPFQAVVAPESIDLCTTITQVGKPMTDRPLRLQGSEPGRPSFLNVGDEIIDFKVHYKEITGVYDPSESLSVSYFSPLLDPSSQIVNDGIAAFAYEFFDGPFSYGVNYINNVISNFGGPATNVFDTVRFDTPGQGLNGQYSVITVAMGPRNIWSLQPLSWTHYYIWPVAYNPCDETITPFVGPTHTPVRVEYVAPPCNDYNHFQFQWMNSLGFWDYFTFTKRNEKQVNINKNTFYKEEWNYANPGGFQFSPGKQGGETVFSQTLEEIFTATTDWLDDKDAKYLENMFLSPSVKVRIVRDDVPDNRTEVWEDVVLLNKSYIQKNYRKDRLFQYDVQFKLSHNIKSQRG